MTDVQREKLRMLAILDRITTVLAVLATIACALTTLATGMTGDPWASLFLVLTGIAAAVASWHPGRVAADETGNER